MKGALRILLEFFKEEQAIAEASSSIGLIQNLYFPLNPKNDPNAGADGQPVINDGVTEDALRANSNAFANSPLRSSKEAGAAKNHKTDAIHKIQNPASSGQVLDLANRVDHDSRP